jgi:hypothetical protein
MLADDFPILSTWELLRAPGQAVLRPPGTIARDPIDVPLLVGFLRKDPETTWPRVRAFAELLSQTPTCALTQQASYQRSPEPPLISTNSNPMPSLARHRQASGPSTSRSRRVVVRGGTVVDGTGLPSYTGDVEVIDGRITESAGSTWRAQRWSTPMVSWWHLAPSTSTPTSSRPVTARGAPVLRSIVRRETDAATKACTDF